MLKTSDVSEKRPLNLDHLRIEGEDTIPLRDFKRVFEDIGYSRPNFPAGVFLFTFVIFTEAQNVIYPEVPIIEPVFKVFEAAPNGTERSDPAFQIVDEFGRHHDRLRLL